MTVIPSDSSHSNRRPRIVLLCTGSPLSVLLINGLRQRFPDLLVLRENPEPKLGILRRRARLFGWREAVGQAAFGVLAKLIAWASSARIAEIIQTFGLDPRPHDRDLWREVGSVNSEACRRALADAEPDVVIVYGTRIIKRETLSAVPAPFINYHAGFNPLYRGQQGAYWALANDDREHAGLTIHLVNDGVDTGDVLYQCVSRFAEGDTIATYQYRQMADALPLMIQAVDDALAGRLAPRAVSLASKLWPMPTLWGYCWTGLTRHVW